MELKDDIGGDCINMVFSEERLIGNDTIIQTAIRVLQTQSYVQRVEVLSDSVAAYVEKGEQLVPRIVELFGRIGIAVKAITLSRPSLNDVFLKHTGHTIRDQEASSAEQFREWFRRMGKRRQ